MQNRLPAIIITLLVAVSASGCFTAQYTIPSEQRRSNYDVVGSFETKQRTSWLIFGLVSLRAAEVEEIVAREIARYDGDAATNVRVTAQYDATDVIVTMIVGGIYNSRSYRVTGDIVNLRDAAGDQARLQPRSPDEHPILGEVEYAFRMK